MTLSMFIGLFGGLGMFIYGMHLMSEGLKIVAAEYKQEANNMATIEKTVESVGMKITVNYGEKDGKIVKGSKTYGDVKKEVTDEAFVGTAKAITAARRPRPQSAAAAEYLRGGDDLGGLGLDLLFCQVVQIVGAGDGKALAVFQLKLQVQRFGGRGCLHLHFSFLSDFFALPQAEVSRLL